MTKLSKCHGVRVYVEDGEYICSKCHQPCDPLPECDADRADREYERARIRGWED